MCLTGLVDRVHCVGWDLAVSIEAGSGNAGSRSNPASEDRSGFLLP